MKITIIPARSSLPKSPYKNVAAYCRVSTKQDIQFHSLEAQRDYYKMRIENNVLWNFVDIYTDSASGRNNLKMKGFQRMMKDCRAGKIDYILMKSISRLGRNTVQFLKACAELNALQVEVYFEVEKLYISDPQAVKLLTVYASLYQNESESKSSAIKWSFQTLFANGKSGFYNTPCYGYVKGDNGLLMIEPSQATVVRLIYTLREEGYSLRRIVFGTIKTERSGT